LQKNKSISVGKAKDQAQISQLFHLPLSDLAHSQMVNLTNTLDSMQLTDDYDSWGYVWGSNIFAASAPSLQLPLEDVLSTKTQFSFGYC